MTKVCGGGEGGADDVCLYVTINRMLRDGCRVTTANIYRVRRDRRDVSKQDIITDYTAHILSAWPNPCR